MASSDRTLIVVAVIGVMGTIGAAVIANWKNVDRDPNSQAGSGSSPDSSAKSSQQDVQTVTAPHAPDLDVAGGYSVWGRKTMLLQLAPGQAVTLYGKNLFHEQATYPVGGCAGPVTIAYSWQIRAPYPKGGDLEIDATRQGGGSDVVGRGSMGTGAMSICDEHTFKNDGLDPIKIEVRYASTAPLEGSGLPS